MTTPTVTSSTDSQMHNSIMVAGSRDRPPMLATGRYPQWRSRFLRYIDTRPNGEALRKCILNGPYKPTTVLVQAVAATDDSLAIPKHTTVETPMNMSPANKAHFESEKELKKCGKLSKGYNKVNPSIFKMSRQTYFGNSIAKPITPPSESASEEDNDPEQAQRDKDMQKNLALIAKYFKKIYKPTNNNLRTSSNSRNKNVYTTSRYKKDNQPGQFGNQRTVNVAGARENVGSLVVQQSGIQCFNCKEFRHFAKECRNPKRVKDSAYHKEKMLLCKPTEKGVPLQEVLTADTCNDSEPLEHVQNDTGYNVFANDLQHSEQFESVSNTCLVETDDSNFFPDCDDDIHNDQNDVESDDERVVLANLIANLKLDVDENKKIQNQLKKANTTLAQELKECKTILAESSKTLGESNRQLAQKNIEIKEGLKTKAYETSVVKEKHDELIKHSLLTKSRYEGLVKKKTKVITYLKLKEEHDIDKMLSMEKQLKFLNEIVYKMSQSIQTIHMMAPKVPTYNSRPTFANPIYLKQAQSEIPCLYTFPYDQSTYANRLIPDGEETLALERDSRSKLNKDSTCLIPLALKTQNDSFIFVHELKQEMHADLKYVESLKKEIDELKYDKVEFLNMYDMILQECVSNEVMCTYLLSLSDLDALAELQCLYLHKVKECDCLAQKLSKQTESVSKEVHTELLQRFAKVENIRFLLQKCKERVKNDTVWNEQESNVFRKEREQYIKIQDLKAQLQEKTLPLQEMHADLKYVESLEKEIDKLESDKAEFSNMYDMILQECVSYDVMCSYLLSLSDLEALAELQCLYLHKVKECDCLAKKLLKQTESVSKEVYIELLQRFAKVEKHSISLELTLQKYLKAQLQDKNIAISELKKLIKKGKGKLVETKFDKPSIVRQPNAQRIPKPSVLGKPSPFSDSLKRRYFSKTKSVPKTNVSEGMYRIDNRTTQTRAPQSPQTFRNTNPCVSTSTGVNHKTNVSRPQHRSNQLEDKVMPNNSQVKPKKTQVKEHLRISSSSNKTKSVTACNDSLNSRTSNVNAVCATCKKCLVDSNHFACVTKMLNDVNARTKKTNVVPISTRKPKGHANKSVATPHKKKVASKSTNQKPHSYFRMLYEKTSKTLKWWIEKKVHHDIKGFLRQKCNWVYYVEGLNHNIFSFGQFCDADLEVAFQKSTCFVRDLQGNDLLTGNRGSNLYTISLQESTSSTPLCLMAKASPIQAWLWHQRLSHLNFDYINPLSKKDVVISLPKLKYVKDQLCSSCDVSKAKRSSFKLKVVPSLKGRLNLLHMDLYAHVPLQQELDLLFGLLYDEFFIAGSNPQGAQPTTNIQPTSAPSTPTFVHAEENNDNQAEEEHLPDAEFTNPFCAPIQEVAESSSSSHNIGNSNVPTFNQPQVSEYRWIKITRKNKFVEILQGQ
nr:retrovirus-related Pol polyprotein from transposon TNT 1-94 [Tanacetum cinerariifolium]